MKKTSCIAGEKNTHAFYQDFLPDPRSRLPGRRAQRERIFLLHSRSTTRYRSARSHQLSPTFTVLSCVAPSCGCSLRLCTPPPIPLCSLKSPAIDRITPPLNHRPPTLVLPSSPPLLAALTTAANYQSDRLGEEGVSLNKSSMDKLCKRHRLHGW